jgi:hypothetical protein
MLRQIEIIGITEGDPINYLENKRPVKHKLSTTVEFMELYMYQYPMAEKYLDEDGWAKLEDLTNWLAGLGYVLDLPMVEYFVNNDKDHRYILSDDKTKIRTSPEHPAPKRVEDKLKNAEGIKIKWSVLVQNGLPSKKDRKRMIHVECSDGSVFDFPYQTNKIFYMDKKHFFLLAEQHDELMLAVSSYMMKDGRYHYRTSFKGFPDVINNLFPDYADLLDYDGNRYRFKIIQKKEQT